MIECTGLTENMNLLTEDGWVSVTDLVEGERVYSKDYELLEVSSVVPSGLQENFILGFQGGVSVDVCSESVWSVTRAGAGTGFEKTLTLEDLLSAYNYEDSKPKGTRRRWPLIPLCTNNKGRGLTELPIAPYVLGFLLGDGCFRTRSSTPFCTVDSEIIEKIESLGYKTNKWADQKGGITYNIKGLRSVVNSLGLDNTHSGNKFIPETYMNSSTEDKLELLKGMMDADGCVNKDSSIEITLKSEVMIDQLKILMDSVGNTCTKKIKIGRCKAYNFEGTYYRLYVRSPNAAELFNLTRKVERTKIKKLRNRLLNHKSVGVANAYTVYLSHDKAVGLITDNYIVIHTKEGI